MAIPHSELVVLVRMVLGRTNEEIAAGIMCIQLHKADPNTVERLLKLMEEDGFGFLPEAEVDELTRLLKQHMDELEA